MARRLRTALVAAALPLAGLSAGLMAVGPAGASSGAPGRLGCANLASARQQVERGLSSRTAKLSRLASILAGSSDLTAGDRATLRAELADEASGLAALGQKVAAASTCAQLSAEKRSLVETYRVGSVLAPQVDLVVVADRLSALTATLTGYEPALRQAVALAAGRGDAVDGAQATLADFASQVDAATSGLSGLSQTLLAQSSAGYPGNRAVFTRALAAEKAARAEIKAAAADGRRILAELTPATSTTSGPPTSSG